MSCPSQSAVAPILVLGLGNDVLSDDAVGLRVAELLRERFADDPAVEVRATSDMGLVLLDEIVGRDSVVLIDAVQTHRAAPGSIECRELSATAGVHASMPHFLGVSETLALGNMLGLAMPQRALLVAIEVADPFTLGCELSPAVAAAVAPAAQRVAQIVAGLRRELAADAGAAPAGTDARASEPAGVARCDLAAADAP